MTAESSWQARVEREYLSEIRRELAEEEEGGREARPAAAEREISIELDRVSISFDDHRVLDDVSVQLFRGETLCILGGSGVGKSTILRLVLLLSAPDGGSIRVQGRDITKIPYEDVLRIRQKMGMVFQGAALFDSLSVLENVAFSLREHSEMSEEGIRERAHEVLRFVDLEPERVAHLLPAELSGGMKKRVAIARAIAHEPEILLFDEPTGGLDPITTRVINELIRKLRRELNVSSMVVTHDIRSAFEIATRVALLYGSRIEFIGTPEEMVASEAEYVREFLR